REVQSENSSVSFFRMRWGPEPNPSPSQEGKTMLMSACLWLRGCMGQRTGQPAIRCGFVTRDQPVQKPDDPAGVTGHGLFVGDHDDGVALLRELLEQCHDLDSGLRIEIARRL